MRKVIVLIVTALVGLAIWSGIAILTGEKEAWGTAIFFYAGIPAMLLASGIAGYIEPESSILMGIAVVSLQPIALFISVKELGPLAVIGLMYFGVFAVLCTGSAFIGAYIRKGPMF